jgi:hypothetical protein
MFGFKNVELEELKKLLDEAMKQRDTYKTRCIELETGIEKGFGIKVRTEVTEVNVAFTAMELSVLHIAICKLMERPLVTEDVEYYLTLRKKIEDLLNVVKE